MNAPKLDKRLRAVVNNIEGKVLADIGCDHGKVAITALLEGRVSSVIACDISAKSLDKAVKLASELNVENIQFRCGDGLKPIADDEVDCVVVAGMGGREITSILTNIPSGIKRFILVAQKNTVELRKFLCEKELTISKDFIVEQSDKFYDVIVAIADGKPSTLSEKELYCGKNSFENEDYVRYVAMLRKKSERFKNLDDKSQAAREIDRALELSTED
ncbi:MAG: class I SAM-dependent methyltransferase [Clostridia bacterium]|nr:class I SAM-dependent methyltransferase [Clostridia bacterium]MDE7329363.1 class I SAM-dependent methyltransferase [Clostridia bacterium]